MKKTTILLFALMCTSIVFGQSKPKVAVYVTGSQSSSNINKVLGDQLVAAIVKSNRYTAIERTASFLSELSKEQNYQHSGAVSDNEIAKLGEHFGVKFVCVADVSEIFGSKYVSARLINVENAEVTKTASTTSPLNSVEELLKVSNNITNELLGVNSSTTSTGISVPVAVKYRAYVQSIGWLNTVQDGSVAGTTGENRRLEAFRIMIDCPSDLGGVTYRAHVESIGWQYSVDNDNIAGTMGRSKRVEAIQIELTGKLANQYDIYYRVHAQGRGWSEWVFNGLTAGTTGQSLRIEAFQVKLQKK